LQEVYNLWQKVGYGAQDSKLTRRYREVIAPNPPYAYYPYELSFIVYWITDMTPIAQIITEETGQMKFEHSKALQKKSHRLIPGGAHTYAKGDDQYPELAPGFLARGKGCHVWDVDGNEYIEYGMGLRAVTLGHAYEPVVEAAHRQMLAGINFTRPAPIEIDCAEKFLDLIEGAEMVKFAKNGSDVTTAALKLARAYTGRDMVAICADHPFFSTDDWFIGSTTMSAGIPEAIQNLTVKFKYNDLASVQALFDLYPEQIACLFMEAETTQAPANNFLHEVKRLCHENGALFILDEIITGFRWHIGGAQKVHGIVPDLCSFGKAMGNGFSIAALAGKREIMELGGLQHDKERVFLLSTTFGAETHSLAAALETMRIYEGEPVIEHLYRQGERLTRGINQAIADNKLEGYFELAGRPCNLVYGTRDADKERSQAFRTLFLQEIIKRGVIAPSLVVSYSHRDEDIDRTIDAITGALEVYGMALEDGVEKYLVGRPVKPVFRKFN
jgi:glutamate-1-semialdehyde 2,1-aminomutase